MSEVPAEGAQTYLHILNHLDVPFLAGQIVRQLGEHRIDGATFDDGKASKHQFFDF